VIRDSQKLDDICLLSEAQKADIILPPKVVILPSESLQKRFSAQLPVSFVHLFWDFSSFL
jgi:hypothetical protein